MVWQELSWLIPSILVPLSTWLALKRTENRLKTWLTTQEGLTFMAQLGAAFASGAMTQLKMGGKATGIKIGPLRIPQQIIDIAMMKGLQMFGITPPPQEQQPQT